MILVVMGVSGVGKTTIGQRLAEALGARFVEGDDAHPPRNVAKMARGEPLDDEDRRPWLEALARDLRGWVAAGDEVVLACSALKRAYRDQLRAGSAAVRFLYLTTAPAVVDLRLASRSGHFFPPALLASQLETLEPPGVDEPAVTVESEGEPEVVVRQALEALVIQSETSSDAP